jgi:hypothetical protein
MDGKVVVLLQLLSSLQESFPSDPVGAASAEEPCVETSEGNAQTQQFTRNGMEQAKHEDMVVEVGMQWENQVTYVEEEPWSEAVHATWPGYLPNV